jgi:hypothetical protein
MPALMCGSFGVLPLAEIRVHASHAASFSQAAAQSIAVYVALTEKQCSSLPTLSNPTLGPASHGFTPPHATVVTVVCTATPIEVTLVLLLLLLLVLLLELLLVLPGTLITPVITTPAIWFHASEPLMNAALMSPPT